MKNKRQGVSAGVPDYLIAIKNRLIFIELKRVGSGKLSDKQKEWINTLNNCCGVEAYVCYGFEEAKNIIDKYNTII